MKSATGLVSFAEQALAAHVGYVYGTFGQLCTTALLDQKARQYPDDDLAGGAMRTVGNKWLGHRVVDCIGLIKYYLMSDRFGMDPTYLQQYDSLNADDLFHAAKESGPIGTLPEIPGLLLHMDGHVGIYIGGGYAIEAAGTANGVIKTRVQGRGWDHWYKCIWLDYGSAASCSCDTSGIVEIARGSAYQIAVTAASVPKVVAGTGDVVAILPRSNSGNQWFYYLVPIGRRGDSVGVYINGGPRQLIVEIK